MSLHRGRPAKDEAGQSVQPGTTAAHGVLHDACAAEEGGPCTPGAAKPPTLMCSCKLKRPYHKVPVPRPRDACRRSPLPQLRLSQHCHQRVVGQLGQAQRRSRCGMRCGSHGGKLGTQQGKAPAVSVTREGERTGGKRPRRRRRHKVCGGLERALDFHWGPLGGICATHLASASQVHCVCRDRRAGVSLGRCPQARNSCGEDEECRSCSTPPMPLCPPGSAPAAAAGRQRGRMMSPTARETLTSYE